MYPSETWRATCCRELCAIVLTAFLCSSAVAQSYDWDVVLERPDDIIGLAASDTEIWAVSRTMGDVYRSVNGTQWTKQSSLLLSSVEKALCMAYSETHAVLLVGTTNGIQYSDDRGVTWKIAVTPLQAPVQDILTTAGNGSTVYAATMDGIIKSTNGGTHWDIDGLNGITINALVYTNRFFHAATSYGIYSRSETLTWASAAITYPNMSAEALAVGDSGRVYASLQNAAQALIVYSSNKGTTWNTGLYTSSGPPAPDPMAVSSDGRLFAYVPFTLYSWRQPTLGREETRLRNALGGNDYDAYDLVIQTATGHAYICGRFESSSVTAGRIYRSAKPTTEEAFALRMLRSPNSGRSGWSLTPSPQVGLLDSYGYPLDRSGIPVTAMLTGGTTGAQLSGVLTRQTNASGTATFPALTVDLAGDNYQLVFQSPALQSAASNAFDIVPGTPAQLSFTAWPASGIEEELLDDFVVEMRDSSGNLTTNITPDLLLTKSPATGTMSGNPVARLKDGIARWDSLSIDAPGGYTFTAQYGSQLFATTPSVQITPAPKAVAMEFVQNIPVVRAGESFTARVHLVDINGVRVLKDTREVRLRIGNEPAPDSLQGVTAMKAVQGEALFDQLLLYRAGAGYYLIAEADDLPDAVSSTFTVVAGLPARLQIVNAMQDVNVDEQFTLQVEVLDNHGNRNQEYTQDVSLSLSGQGAGQLQGTTTRSVRGLESFTGLSIDAEGQDYRIEATSTGLNSDLSNAFDVRPTEGNRLRFTTEPVGGSADTELSTQPRVIVEDRNGQPIAVEGLDVTLSVLDEPGVAIVGGSNPVPTTAGVAEFNGLAIREAGSGYRLLARAAGMIGDTSVAFSIIHGQAAQLLYRSQPGNAQVNAAIPAVVIAVEDQWQNPATTSPVQISMSIERDAGGGAILAGGSPQITVDGEARFDALSLNKPGNGYTLRATSPGLPNAVSQPFDITGPGTAVRVAFEAEPAGGSADQPLSPQPVVTVLDADGQLVESSAQVEITVLDDRAELLGTTVVNAEQGRASFGGLRIAKAGDNYALIAHSSGLIADTSAPFTVTPGPPVFLVWQEQPSDVRVNTVITPAIVVGVTDSEMNLVESSTADITLSILDNPGQATLQGTTVRSASTGIARFDDIALDAPGSPYTLRALSPGFQELVSQPFTVTPGIPTKLVFLQEPSDAGVDETITPEIVVAVVDDDLNIIESSTAVITLAIGDNPGSATLQGTTARAATDGIAQFNDISLNAAGAEYTLWAASAGLESAESQAFDIVGETELLMSITGGDDQSGVVESTLPEALEVTLRYGNGAPAQDIVVNFTLEQPGGASGGAIDPVAATSGADGRARTVLTLGNRTGTYRVTAESDGVTGSPQIFTATAEPTPYPASVQLNHTWNFPVHEDKGAYTPFDYRIIALPGDPQFAITDLLIGDHLENWKLFTDDGSEGEPSDYLLPYDGSDLFRATHGRAFWLLHRGDVHVQRTVSSAPIDAGRSASISLHPGWNLIGNPFPRSLPWSVVQEVNDISDPLYRFDDIRATDAQLEPYYGYYYYNRDDRGSLSIPWDSTFTATRVSADGEGWTIDISLEYATMTDRTLSFGVHPRAEQMFDKLDWPKPRGIGGAIFAYFSQPGSDGALRYGGRDLRSDAVAEQHWTLSIESHSREAVTLEFLGLQDLPMKTELFLEDPLTGEHMNLRRQSRHTVFTSGDPYHLAIVARPATRTPAGSTPVVESMSLGSPYPNPTARGAVVALNLPQDAYVDLSVRDVLGRVVRRLHAGVQRRGRSLYYWNGRDDAGYRVGPGTYFIHARMAAQQRTSSPVILLAP